MAAPQVTPYLYYSDATEALAFLVEAFGFAEIEAFRDEDGHVLHAQVSTGDGVVLLGPGMAEFGTQPVAGEAGVSSRTFVQVDDPDGHCERARAAGATILVEPGDFGPNHIYITSDVGGQQWIFARPLGG